MIHYHWIMDTVSKNEILFFDSRMKMGGEIDNEIIKNFALNPFQMQQFDQNFAFLYLQVERGHIIEQTLNFFLSENINLRKPLKVKFVEELGVDEGGVQKEFF